MLKKIWIENIAIIDRLEAGFGEGLNCLSGETGAGKSIIIDSITALLGSKTSRELVRSGENKGYVKGYFTGIPSQTLSLLKENGIDALNDTLEIEREISAGGRNICRINGKNVSGAVLRSVGETLIDIHGQHENQALSKTGSHITLLDSYGSDTVGPLLSEYRLKLSEFNGLKKELESLSGDSMSRERTIDLLKYQVREIEGAQLTPGEEEELINRRDVLNNSKKIAEHLVKASETVGCEGGSSSVTDMMEDVVLQLSHISGYDKAYSEAYGLADSICANLTELKLQLDKLRTDMELCDAGELEWVVERLNYVKKLENKYGSTIEDILEFGENARNKLEFYNDSEANVRKIKEQMSILSDELYKIAEKLSDERKNVSVKLGEEIMSELQDLEMGGTEFMALVDFEFENDAEGFPVFGPYGLDNVEFLISPNRGEPLKPLSRIASGGELSRIMLAIKNVFNRNDRIPTMIFDEIDTGISGIAAKRIADKMVSISSAHQVICVTHHAQIAAAANENLFVSKETEGNRTNTRLKVLDTDGKISEISRLLDGNTESEITRMHAAELINSYRG